MTRLIRIFLLCTVSALAIGLAACTDNPQHEHGWEWAYDQSTHWQECGGCDQIQSSGEHDYTEGVCSVCGYADPTYAPHSHTYGEWQIFAPGYMDEGRAIKICTTCENGEEGHAVEVILPPLSDPRYEKTVEDGACIDSGLVIYSITINGETLTFSVQYINAGHKLKHYPATAATCTESGNTAYWQCTVCGKYFADLDIIPEIKEGDWITPAKGHTLEKHESVAPNCTESGNIEYFDCSVCGNYFVEGNGELVETTLNDIILPPEGHALQEHAGVPVDCETPGIRDYWECMVCRKYFSDGEGSAEIDDGDLIIPATGHSFSDWRYRYYFYHYRRSSCKHEIYEEEPHEYEDGACKVCGYAQPKFYFDEDAPDGQSGYIVIYDFTSSIKCADIYLPYLFNQTDPEQPIRIRFSPDAFLEVNYDEQYGKRYMLEKNVGGIWYNMQFYCDFEEGDTFKIHSLAQRYEFFQTVDENSGYLFYICQSVHQTSFADVNDLTAASLCKTDANGWNRQYLTPSHLEYSEEESCIYWYCELEEGETVEKIYRIDVTFDGNGKLSAATVSQVHTYKDE